MTRRQLGRRLRRLREAAGKGHDDVATAQIARAVSAANTALDPEAVERRVAFRLARQRAFFDRPKPGRLDAVPTSGTLGLVVGSTAVMDFAGTDDPPIVHLESLVGSRYVERPDQVAAFRRAFDQVRAQAVPLEEYAR